MIDTLIENIKKKINLSMDETEQLFDKIFKGEVDTSSLTSLLDALDKKGETPDELAGATISMRKNSKSIDVNHNQVIDCCGTGGLGKKMINVSTSVSFVLAAAGLKVAKHGNRTATGKSGSADFLEAAGINLNESSKYFSDSLDKIGLGFLFAQNHHPGMKYVMEARRILGKKTIFNLLGPLSNPAGANIQSIGVFHVKWIKPIGEALRNLNCKAAAIFHSDDGLDEISFSSKTQLIELSKSELITHEIDPKAFNIKSKNLSDLEIDSPQDSVRKVIDSFENKFLPGKEIISLNAAPALKISCVVDNFEDGYDLAYELISSGKALEKFDEFINFKS